MQIVEVTLGAESKKPGAAQYTSETKSAFVKIAVHPGDVLDDVLAAGRDALRRALADAPSTTSITPPPPAPNARGWSVLIYGAKPMNTGLRSLGLGWKDDHHEGVYANETEARKIAKAATMIGTDLRAKLRDLDGREHDIAREA